MPTQNEEKDELYKTIEKKIMEIKALEHFIYSKELEDFVSQIYSIDPFYYSMEVSSDNIVQDVQFGVKMRINQLKDQIKGYIS